MVRDRLRSRFADETGHAIEDAIKQVALSQLAAGGPGALSVNAIARELGVSGPALYRYYPGRDELLDDVVIDAYDDLALKLRSATEGAGSGEGPAALADGYRAWALAQPHRYRLLYAPVLPSFDPHRARLAQAAQQVMDVVLAVLTGSEPTPSQPWSPELDPAGLRVWAANRGVDDSTQALRAVLIWTRLHGLASLEIDGNYAALGLDPAPLYRREVQSVLEQYPLLPE